MSFTQRGTKSINIIYFTNPICANCWAIDPQLNKLKLTYGRYIDIKYYMGGIPSMSPNVSGKCNTAPIDDVLWLKDIVRSSCPPSIAFKAAQIQDTKKAIHFLRVIREMIFEKKKNLTKWAFLEAAAEIVGLDIYQFRNDFERQAKTLFQSDLAFRDKLGVTSFPTLFFSNGREEFSTTGYQPYSEFENIILQLCPNAKKEDEDARWSSMLQQYKKIDKGLNQSSTNR